MVSKDRERAVVYGYGSGFVYIYSCQHAKVKVWGEKPINEK